MYIARGGCLSVRPPSFWRLHPGARPSLEEVDVHSIASLLKLYLRELPEALMTAELHRNFLNAVQFYKLSDHKVCDICDKGRCL